MDSLLARSVLASALAVQVRRAILLLLFIALALPLDLYAALTSEAEPLVLNVHQGRVNLTDGLLAFRRDDGTLYLPLGELCQVLGFDIEIDPEAQRASGHYLLPDNRFELDLAQGHLESAAQTLALPADAARVEDGEIYVPLAQLNRWFDQVQFRFDESYLFIDVESTPLLPVVLRMARAQSNGALSASLGNSSSKESNLPKAVVDYRLLRPPVVDLGALWSWDNSVGNALELELHGAQDLAYMGAQWYLALSDDQQPREARLTLSRKDPDGTLLGPLGLSEIELGDVSQSGVPLVSRGLRGRGVRLSNMRRALFTGSVTQLEGELPSGWDVELYRNGVLIAYGDQATQGQYRFDAVELQSGLNDLMLVLYGPQGQRVEQHKAIRIGASQPANGEWYLEWVGLQQGRDTLGDWVDDETRRQSEAQNALSQELHLVYGLAAGVTLRLSGYTLSEAGVPQHYSALAALFSLFGMGVRLDSAQSPNGAEAYAAQLNGELFGLGLLWSHEHYTPLFTSPINDPTNPLASSDELRLNRRFNLPLPSGTSWPLNSYLSAKRKQYVNGNAQANAALGLASDLGPLHLTHTLSGSYSRSAGRWRTDTLEGRLNLSTRLDAARLRATLAYGLHGHTQLNNIDLNANLPLFDAYRLDLGLTHDTQAGEALSAGLTWRRARADYALQLSHNSESGESRLSLDIRSVLDWSGGGLAPRIRHGALSGQGLVNAQVFIDHDRDGLFSAGDEPMPEVRIAPARAEQRSDAEGRLTIDSISELTPTEVTLREGSLPDPFLRSQVSGYNVMVRPGAALDLAFPLAWVSDIEGKVLVNEEQVNQHGVALGRHARGLGNAQVQVLDPAGNLVRSARSEFDGFFAITNLPSGHYRVQLAPEQAERFELTQTAPLVIELADDTAVLSGLELLLDSPKPHLVYQRDATPPAP